jgi:hypothetical protein
MATTEGWHPDPAGRYSHRWWDGRQWTARVADRGTLRDDPVELAAGGGKKLICGVCHQAQGHGEWSERCTRCAEPLRHGYLASKPQADVKLPQVMRNAQAAFDAALVAADEALAQGEPLTAVRHLDAAIRHGVTLRAIAFSTNAKQPEPLALAGLIELHMQAVRLLGRSASWYDPEAFEIELLHRFAAMYAPDGRTEVPEDVPSLVAFCAARVAWAEHELPAINAFVTEYCEGYTWESIRYALTVHGYTFGTVRAIGPGAREAAAELLGIDVTAGASEVKKAWRRAATKFHPDVLGDVPADLRAAAEEKMKEINAAYELLNA